MKLGRIKTNLFSLPCLPSPLSAFQKGGSAFQITIFLMEGTGRLLEGSWKAVGRHLFPVSFSQLEGMEGTCSSKRESHFKQREMTEAIAMNMVVVLVAVGIGLYGCFDMWRDVHDWRWPLLTVMVYGLLLMFAQGFALLLLAAIYAGVRWMIVPRMNHEQSHD